MFLPAAILKTILSTIGGAPLYADNAHATLAKIVTKAGGDPRYGDTGAALLKKWLSALGGAQLYSDTVERTLDKIAVEYGAPPPFQMNRDGKLAVIASVASGGGPTPPPPFNPEDVPGLEFWLDANDPAFLFQDEQGTIPAVANADPIGLWNNKYLPLGAGLVSPGVVSGGGATNKPTLRTNVINGKSVVRFDGSNDFIVGVNEININGPTLTVFMVVKRNSFINANEDLMSLSENDKVDFDITGSGASIGSSSPNSTVLVDARADEDMSILTHPGDGVPFIYESKYNGTTQQGWVNGATVAPVANAGSVGSFVIQRIILGFRYANAGNPSSEGGLSNASNNDIAEVLIYEAAVSPENQLLIRNYLATKWGITVV
jgi:hypothetical protein